MSTPTTHLAIFDFDRIIIGNFKLEVTKYEEDRTILYILRKTGLNGQTISVGKYPSIKALLPAMKRLLNKGLSDLAKAKG